MGIEAASGCGIERFTVPRAGMKMEMCGLVARAVWLACSRIRWPEDNASVFGSSLGWARIVEAHPGTHNDLRSEASVSGTR